MNNTSIKRSILIAVLGIAAAVNAGERVVCHYPTVTGYVGVELTKPNGDHYFDVDFFDFDTAPEQVGVDGYLTGVTGQMDELGLAYG